METVMKHVYELLYGILVYLFNCFVLSGNFFLDKYFYNELVCKSRFDFHIYDGEALR